MNRPTDDTYSKLLVVGAYMAVGGFLLGGLMLLGAGMQGRAKTALPMAIVAGLFLFCCFVGIIMIGVTLAMGIKQGKGKSATVFRYDGSRVIARFAMNEAGEMLFDEMYIDFDEPSTKLFVRLQAPGEGSHEYRCNEPIWWQCGEGMVGTAYVQGDWVGQFTPTGSPGPRQTYREG